MSRTAWDRGARVRFACLVFVFGVFFVLAGVARAASETTDSAGLQAALTQAQTGDTITLDQPDR